MMHGQKYIKVIINHKIGHFTFTFAPINSRRKARLRELNLIYIN
jgi:hypothetical protein